MKLTATVMGQRRKSDLPMHLDYDQFESFAIADVLVDGDNMLIAATLRALADVLDPPSEQLADWERDLLKRDAIERRMHLVQDSDPQSPAHFPPGG